ncbi:hydrogen peroxide-dependent heme synthase [Roseibacillus ishigakijimensis]|uniref:Heme-dependent peroxidase n=1 Tax=Roseibacillus ishigakijimensis TaxID=454146 RepID=A0A934RKI1_9BACT|nr:hydrogen peroxide-dependent heme synthase [Roseibacillus ishigakijimensis]MBK1833392.1 heme-dependent peroxidase [Roseibacillus ishigakijimensis]
MTDEASTIKVSPEEGWHVLHLYYHIDHGQWSTLSRDEKREAKTRLTELVQEIRSTPDTQLLTFAIATPKADLGFMLLTPDLVTATQFEKRLTLSLGPDILAPTYSYLSQTERSEYTTTRDQYARETLVVEKGMAEGSKDYNEALQEFDERMAKYSQHRLYPVLPDWPVVCFYPMSKRRNAHPDYNWYETGFESRRELMMGHARTGRKYSGKILQLITGSTGLDEHEWGVTLLAHDTYQVKSIVYEMRFDDVSARYGEFGDFYIGLQLPLDELFRRICL